MEKEMEKGGASGEPAIPVGQPVNAVAAPGVPVAQPVVPGAQPVVPVAQPVMATASVAIPVAAVPAGLPSPPGCAEGGHYKQFNHVGPMTCVICLVLDCCCCVFFCPCDPKMLYVAPDGKTYNPQGLLDEKHGACKGDCIPC